MMMVEDAVKLVVFDLAGTAVDHGCMAPMVAFVEAFEQIGIEISQEQARGPMGLHKRDHIRELLGMSDVARQWQTNRGRPWREEDVQQIYDGLMPRQKEIAVRYAEVVPGLPECFELLRRHEIAIAATTGYPRSVAQPILDQVAEQGFPFDSSVCADEVPAGRPAPWMIFRSMEKLGAYPPSSVIKVGDTVPDVQAARNAGVWAVGVTETGSEFGMALEQLNSLSAHDRSQRNQRAEEKLRGAGAHFVIRSLADLPAILSGIR